jgi:hypothetical protein
MFKHAKSVTDLKKATGQNVHSLIFIPGAPMERVHIDFLGPLPETNSGNSNILVMVDQFTKWVEIIPLSSQTAEIQQKLL